MESYLRLLREPEPHLEEELSLLLPDLQRSADEELH